MNHTQTYYISSKENHDMQKNKVLCQEKNNSLMIQFDNLSSLNRANVKYVFQRIKQHFSNGKNMFIDLRGINSIDARGLALLIHLNKKIHSLKGKLVLTNPSAVMQKILWLTEIDRIIKVRMNCENVKATKVMN